MQDNPIEIVDTGEKDNNSLPPLEGGEDSNGNVAQEKYNAQLIDLTLQENDEEGTIEEIEHHYTRSSKRKIKMEPNLHGTLGAYWRGQPTKYAGVPYQKRTINAIHSVNLTLQENDKEGTIEEVEQLDRRSQRIEQRGLANPESRWNWILHEEKSTNEEDEQHTNVTKNQQEHQRNNTKPASSNLSCQEEHEQILRDDDPPHPPLPRSTRTPFFYPSSSTSHSKKTAKRSAQNSHHTRSSKRKINMEPSLHGTLGAYWQGQPTKYAGVPYQKRTSNVIHSVDTSQKNLATTTASSQQQQQEQKELPHISPQNDQGSLSKTPDSSPRRSMQSEDDSYTAAQKAIWEENFQRLVAFKKRHKTTRVPRSYKPLGNWVRYQQRCYKGENKKRLSKYRIRRLNSIDFAWEANTALSVPLTAIQTKEKQEFPQEMKTSTMTNIAHNLLLAPTLNRQWEKKLEREGKRNHAISNDDWRNNKEKPRMAGMPRPLQIQLKNCPPIRVVWDYGELRLGRLLHPKFKRTDSKIDDDQPQYGMPRIVWKHGPDRPDPRPDPQLEATLNDINSTSNNGQPQDEQYLRVVWNNGCDCLGQQLQFVFNFEAQNRRLPSADGSQDESLVELNHNRNEDYGYQPKTNAAGHALTLEEKFANIVHTTSTGTEGVPTSGTENGEATGVSNETAIFVTDEESSNEIETENPATIPKIANHQATDIQLQEQILKNPNQYHHHKFENIDLICFRSSMHSEDEAAKIVIPESLLQDVIRWYHRTKSYSDHILLYEDISTKFYAPLLYQKCYEILSNCNNIDALETPPRVYEPVGGTQSMDLLESLSIGSDATFNLLESSTYGSIQDTPEDLTDTCNMDLSLLKTTEERRILEDYLFNRGICDLTELTMKGLEGCSGRVLEAFLRSMNVQTGIMGRRLRKDELMVWVYNRVWRLEKHELIEWYHNRAWEAKTQDHLLETLSIGSDATFEAFDLLENGHGSLIGCNNPTGGTCNMDFSLLQSTEQRKRLVGFLKEKGVQDLTELTMQELEDCPKIVMMAFLRSLNVKVYVKRALKHVVLNKDELMECIQNRVWENEANQASFGTFNPLESGTQGIHLDQVSLTGSYTHVNNQAPEYLTNHDKPVGEIGRDQPIRDTRDMDMSLLKTTEERKLLGDYLEEKGVQDLTELTMQELEECPKVVVMAFLRSMNIQVYINQQLLSKGELIELVQNKVWEEGANMCWI